MDDLYFMKQAFLEAHKAYDEGEVPVGVVIVSKFRIIARGHNLVEKFKDVTAHAEIQAITAATEYLGSKYLNGCTMYVTLEPCVMCAGALFWSQISELVFAAEDRERGYRSQQIRLHPKTSQRWGVMQEECSELLLNFFRSKRDT